LIGYVLLSLLVFGILIFVHELGHFLTAKAAGVQVNEFALGMGPAIIKRTYGETTYSLRWIPMGGYCAMEGEDETSDDPRAFTSAKPWKRIVILIAGSCMNFLAGLLILGVLFSFSAGYVSPTIDSFFENSTLAEETGLREGDTLYRIDGRRVYLYTDVSMLLSRNTTGMPDLQVLRDGRIVDLGKVPLIPKEYVVDGEPGLYYGLRFTPKENSPAATLRNTWYTALDFSRMVWMGLTDLVTGAAKVSEMSGPVGIVSVMAQTGESSETVGDAIGNIAYFAAFLAVNLALMNMLPIPALDGGRVFFLLISVLLEKLLGRKLPAKYEGAIHAAGMVLLFGLLAVITLKDILYLFR